MGMFEIRESHSTALTQFSNSFSVTILNHWSKEETAHLQNSNETIQSKNDRSSALDKEYFNEDKTPKASTTPPTFRTVLT